MSRPGRRRRRRGSVVVVARARRQAGDSRQGGGEQGRPRAAGHPDTLAARRRPRRSRPRAASLATVEAMGDTDIVPLVHDATDITAAWCDAALRPRLGAARVVAARTDPVGTGQVADTVRIHLEYDPPGAGPATLVAKVPSADETSRGGAAATRTYEIEASFYRDLAAELPVRTPDCWYAAHDPATNAYIVVLEDVAPAVQGDQMHGCSVEDIAAAVDELVLLHGPRWDDPALRRARLARTGRRPSSPGAMAALITWAYESFREHYAERLEPATVELADRFIPRIGDYVRHRPEPWTVVHGDFRADNLLFGGPRVVVVDWQTVTLGPGPSDLAYLLGASLLPDVRRGPRSAGSSPATSRGLRGLGVTVDERRGVGRLPAVRVRRPGHGDRRPGARAPHRPRRRDVHHDGRPPQPPGPRPRQRVAAPVRPRF